MTRRGLAATKLNGQYVITIIGNKLDPDYGKRVAKHGVQLVVLDTDGHLFLDVCRRMNTVKFP